MAKLEQGILDCLLTIEHKNKDGNIIYKKEGQSNSWVENFYSLLHCQASASPCNPTGYGLEYYNTSGTICSSATTCARPYGLGLYYNSDPDYYLGPEIGTGTAVESSTLNSLGAIILNGATSGKMVHSIFTIIYTLVGTTRNMKIDRTFTNNSGGSIAVTECGLYAYMSGGVPANQLVMINRDLIPSINVAAGESLYVAYTIQLTFPE